jgi:hypothetical protein
MYEYVKEHSECVLCLCADYIFTVLLSELRIFASTGLLSISSVNGRFLQLTNKCERL